MVKKLMKHIKSLNYLCLLAIVSIVLSCGNSSKTAAVENVQQDETQGENPPEAEAIDVQKPQAPDLSLLDASLDALIVYPTSDNPYKGYFDYSKYESNPDIMQDVAQAYVYEKYTVICYFNYNDFSVYPFSPNKNFEDYDEKDNLIELPSDGMAFRFMGIRGKYLFYDEGTSTFPRELGIIDLETGKQVYRGIWKGDELEFIDDHIVKVYEILSSVSDEETSGQHVTMQAYSFDLNTLKTKKLEGDVFKGLL
jgi:hypothetical protein